MSTRDDVRNKSTMPGWAEEWMEIDGGTENADEEWHKNVFANWLAFFASPPSAVEQIWYCFFFLRIHSFRSSSTCCLPVCVRRCDRCFVFVWDRIACSVLILLIALMGIDVPSGDLQMRLATIQTIDVCDWDTCAHVCVCVWVGDTHHLSAGRKNLIEKQ